MKELEAQKKAEFGEDYKLSEDDLHGVVFPECRRDVDLDSLEYVSVAECAEYDQKHILETLPIQRFVDTAGADHVYFLSYNSFGNNMEIAKELNNMIKQVIKKTGHDKVNLVSISMGGSITDTLLEVFNNEEYIADNGGDCNLNSLINRIVYIVPALNGSRTISDIFEFGLLDDDDALYDYMFPALVGEEGYTGELINILIRLFPKDVLNGIIDSCVDELINRVLRYSTTIWGLITYEHYEGGDGLVSCADKYLSDPELAELRRQTDIFHTAQGNRFKNIQSAIDSGVDVLNVSDYNYDLYAIVDAYNEVNSDGIIPIDSAALGATSFGNNVQLPEGYQPDPESCHCTNPEHNHIDPYNILDASTGYLPENTWYVYGQDHESTGHCQVVLDLCVDLLLDYDFDTIYDRPEYPQFILYKNTEDQDIRKMIADTAAWDISRVSEDSAAALGASIDELNTIYENNIADKNRYDSAVAQFKNCYDDVRYQLMNDDQKADYDNQKKAEKRDNAIGAVLGKLNDFLNRTLGYKGFSDIFRWW